MSADKVLKEKGIMFFKKLERSYFTPAGWRLATVEEARGGLAAIKERGVLNKWDRARLLDGWISGPGYDFKIGDDFRMCLGYMLVVSTDSSMGNTHAVYENVPLSDQGKHVALLLCGQDWNFEIVYWLLNSWAKREILDHRDVSEGKVPFSDVGQFKRMCDTISFLARKFEEQGPPIEQAANKKFSDPDSVAQVLSGMIKIAEEQKESNYRLFGKEIEIDNRIKKLSEIRLEPTWVGVEAAAWSFLSECFASSIIDWYAYWGLEDIKDHCATETINEKNFKIATDILLYISRFRCQIIHAPLGHSFDGSCVQKIICYLSQKAAGDPQRFEEMVENNAMWRCYEDNGNYDVLNKLLVLVAMQADAQVVNMLLECGAGCETTLDEHTQSVLHYVSGFGNEDEGLSVAKKLLGNFSDAKRQQELVNAKDSNGWTALHWAVFRDRPLICELFLENGGDSLIYASDNERRTALHWAAYWGCQRVSQLLLRHNEFVAHAEDAYGQTVLHLAAERLQKEVLYMFMEKKQPFADVSTKKDFKGRTVFDIAVAKPEIRDDIKLVAKLLSKFIHPEAYFNEVNRQQLLRQSLLDGYTDIVEKLVESGTNLPDGGGDDAGKTTLHLAADFQDESIAMDMVKKILTKTGKQEKENFVATCDGRGRTCLHKAVLKGYTKLSEYLLDVNPKLINVKDKDFRNPLYYAVQRGDDEVALFEMLVGAYLEEHRAGEDLRDYRGLTPLHLAVSEGKKQIVKVLLSKLNSPKEVVKGADCLGQTALHKATICARSDIIKVLFQYGAHPLEERDLDGRTALHYAVQAKTGQDGVELGQLILSGCKRKEEKALLLWASAAGVGTADQNITDPRLQKFLAEEKEKFNRENLLKMAARLGNMEMTKELLTRGGEIADIQDQQWRNGLNPAERENVVKVSQRLEKIAEQGNDQPTITDNLERVDFAYGLAVLLLNPYIKPPIAVGIFGRMGSGKSSLMLQTESFLLKTSAELALLSSSSTSNFPGVKDWTLSETGEKKYKEIRRQLDLLLESGQYSENFFMDVINKIKRTIRKGNNEGSHTQESGKNADSLVHLLNKYDPKYHEIFKSLAVMDRSDMFTKNVYSSSRRDSLLEGRVPAILTVRYNAWSYKNETEALAGMAVEISKEMEKCMTKAQWLSTCWRNTWRKQKYSIWIEYIFPCLLTIVLVCSSLLIVWLILESFHLKAWVKAKYTFLPIALVSIAWTLTKAVRSILNPVSSQLMYYIKTPDHTDKLCYQERVISDISFLKNEIGKKSFWVFSIYVALLHLITDLKWWFTYFFSNPKCSGETWAISKVMPASSTNLRIIVFVDDLDKCQESVILQVLSAINLVLAVCEISVVLGMDKEIMERAVVKKYGEQKTGKSFKGRQEFSDKYMEKIIQLPLDLPEPSEKQLRKFLERHLGVFHEEDKVNALKSKTSSQKPTLPVKGVGRTRDDNSNDSSEGGLLQDNAVSSHVINMSSKASVDSSILSIRIKEMLFTRYSEGERDAFCYFETLTSRSHKTPRQWKGLLNYHRLAWNILSFTNEAKGLVGWQVQLITWIFICWEWPENMNILIENWNNINILKSSQLKGPSLQMIVEHFVKEQESHVNSEKIMTTHELYKSNEGDVNNISITAKDYEINKKLSPNKIDDTKEQIQSLRKEMKELKEKMMRKKRKKNDEKVEEVEVKQQTWSRLRSALKMYDVTMEGIQMFQKFRFHCKSQHLSWPLLKEENVKV